MYNVCFILVYLLFIIKKNNNYDDGERYILKFICM